MLRSVRWLGIAVFLAALTAVTDCQFAHAWVPGNPPGINRFCQPQPPRPRPVVRTVQVDVPAPCCLPAPVCSPYPRCAPPCPPPCPTRPVNVRVDVVVRPENKKPCCPQRYCCENPPVFEPIFYHAAWMIQSLVAAPLGLGERMLGHGAIRQPCPPPIPVPCVPCRVAPCPRPAQMCQPPSPQCMSRCQPVVRCAPAAPAVALPMKCRPQQACLPHRNAPMPR